ncbi:hypothetical protein, partial [Tahibacter caeni]|uniref:hypothetical protein n=1 Tax=Tahibacter caeni TaxID=1453545 RepID=UPI0021492366
MRAARLFAAALFAAASVHAADGDPDTGFAGGAVASQSVDAPYYQSYEPAAALGDDGSVAVIGVAGVGPNTVASRFAIAKFRSDGSADPGFGSLGVATVDFSGDAADYPAYGRGIARLADGGWVVAGRVGAAHDVGV